MPLPHGKENKENTNKRNVVGLAKRPAPLRVRRKEMSENLKALDEFPTFTGEESPQEQIRQLQNYLYVVKEQLRYALSNLSEKNLNPTAWAAMQKQTLDSQSQEAVFNKLFDNGNVQGFDIEDGMLYINGALAKLINLVATNIVAGILKSKDGETFYLDLDKGILKMQATEFSVKGKKVDEIVQKEVSAFSDAVAGQLANLQSQIDGNITTWFGDYVPSTSNKPASEWATDEIKNQHLGDLFYIVDNAEQGGFVYRWAMVGGAYSWQIVEDVEVAKALEQAAKAQDTADGKRRVFVAQPAPPYDVGDLWTDGANLRVCQTARGTGAYAASDWTLATNYIAKEDLSHEDIFNMLFKDGKVQGFEIYENRLYINGQHAQIVNLIAEAIVAGVLRSKDGTVEVDLDNNTVTINGMHAGKKTKLVMSHEGFDGYGENSDGVMEHALSISFGVGGRGTTILNPAWQENTGMTLATASGELSIGTSEAGTLVTGASVDIEPLFDLNLSSWEGNVCIAGRAVYWRDNGDGTSSLVSANK